MIISATVTSLIIGFGVSGLMAGASYLYQRFTQKSLDVGDNNFGINPTDTRAHLPIVYGRAKLGASRIFTKTDPDSLNDIYAAYACCHGEIGDFEKIWFDKEKVIDYVSESLSNKEGYNEDRWSHDGDLDVDINKRLGGFNPDIYPQLQNIFGSDEWTNYHLGAGVASVQVKLHLPSALEDRQKVFPGGFPNEILLQVKGQKIQDIRQKLIVRSCETTWSYSDGNVTQSTVTGKVGTYAVRATVGAGAGTNTLLFADNFAAKDLSTYNAITLWFRSSVDTDAGDLQLLLDNTSDCASPLRTINLPHFDANKWKRVIVNYDDDLDAGMPSIISIGIKQVTDIGACTLDIDDIWATIYEFDYMASRTLVEDCEDAWNEKTVSGVTLSTTTGKHGNAARASILNLANDSIIMTEAIGSQSFAGHTSIQFWIRSSVKTHQGDLQFLIDDSAQCASPLLTLDIPALKADTWKKVELKFPDPSVLTGIISLGIKLNSKINGDADKKLGASDVAYTIDIDDVYVIERLTIGNNPALCAYDYITNPVYGDGAEPSEMDETSFITEANYCDEVVSSPLNPPAACAAKAITDNGEGLLKKDNYYRFKVSFVRSDGTESKLSPASKKVKTTKNKRQIQLTNIPIADADNVVQRKIYATKGFKSGNGGTYYLHKTIGNNNDTTLDVNFTDTDLTIAAPSNVSITKNMKRFTCNGVIDTAREIKTNLEDLLTSCRANIFYECGKYVMFIKKVATAETAIELTEDNIIGDWKWSMPAAKEMANIIKASYINKNKGYETDYIVWPKARETNQYLIDDNYFENIKEINLNYTLDAVRAKQIAMVVLKESRDTIKVSCKCKEEALQLRVGSVVNVTHSTPAWVDKPFWVEGIGIAQDGNILVSLSSYTAANYTYDTITEDDEESTSEDIPAMEEEATESAGTTVTSDLGDPPMITGLEIIHNRGNESTMSGSDFEVRWDAVTEKKESSKYAISAYSSDDYYSDMASYSSEGIRYLIEIKFSGIADSVKINNVKVNSKIAYSETTTKLTFKFSLADNIEAAKKLWKNHSTHASYATYYGSPQRQITISIATLNEKNRKSVYKSIILTNPVPDMNNSAGANTSPVLKALKSGVRVKFIHPYQEYDISHFMVQYAENAAFTTNLKKIRVSSAITVNSTDDELDSTQYKLDIDGLDPKKTYYVRVRPHDTYGAGTFSATASIAPGVTDDDANEDIVVPAQVAGVTLSINSNNNVVISWNNPSGSDDTDVVKAIIDWRASQFTGTPTLTLTSAGGNIPILSEVDQGYLDSDNTKLVIGEKKSIEINLDETESHTKNRYIVKGAKTGYTYFVRVRFENSSRKQGAWSAWAYNATAVTGLSEDDMPSKWAMYKFVSPGAVTAYNATQITWVGGTGILKKKTNSGSTDIDINTQATPQTITPNATMFLCYTGSANLALKTEAQLDADATFVAIAKCTTAPSGKCKVLMMVSAEHFRISAYEAGFNLLSAVTADLGEITAGTVTGATIQTGTGNAKVIIDSSGLRAYNSSGTQRVQISNDGSGWLGASGKLYWDTAGNLTVTGVVADSVAAENVIAGTMTGSTIQTASSGKRFKVSTSNNHAEFYGDRGDTTVELLASIGINQDGSDYFVADLGNLTSGNTRIPIRARSYGNIAIIAESYSFAALTADSTNDSAIYATSFAGNGINAVSGSGNGIDASSTSGYGGIFYGNTTKAPLRIIPQSAQPSSTDEGQLYYDSDVDKLYLYAAGAWVALN